MMVCVLVCGLLLLSPNAQRTCTLSDAPDMDTIAEQERRYAMWSGRAQMVAAKAVEFLLPPDSTAALRPTWARRCAVGQLRVCLPRLKDHMAGALGEKSNDLYALLMVCGVDTVRVWATTPGAQSLHCSGSACADPKRGILAAVVPPGQVGPAARCVGVAGVGALTVSWTCQHAQARTMSTWTWRR